MRISDIGKKPGFPVSVPVYTGKNPVPGLGDIPTPIPETGFFSGSDVWTSTKKMYATATTMTQ